MNPSYYVGVENCGPVNTCDKLSASHKSATHKHSSAYTANHGLVKVFEEGAVNANQRPNVATCGPMKTCEEVSVSHKAGYHKNISADTENHGRVKVFEDIAVDHNHKFNANQRPNVVACGPMKTSVNQTSIKNRAASLKQAVSDTASSEVEQSTGGGETDSVSVDSRLVREKDKDIQSQVAELCVELTAEELHNVYTRVFHRR